MPTIPRTYLTTQKSTIGNIQPKNGQVIALWDTDGVYYDVPANGAVDGTPVRRKISSLIIIYTLSEFIPRAGGTGTKVPMEDIIYVYIRQSTDDPEMLPETTQPLYDMRVWIGDADTGEWYITGTNRDDANVKSEASSGKFYLTGSPTMDTIVGSLVKNSAIYVENNKINGTITHAETADDADEATLAHKAETDAATPPKAITNYLYNVATDATTNLGSTLTFTKGDGTTTSVRVSDTTYSTYTSAQAGLVPPTSNTVAQDTSDLLLSGDGWIDKDDIIVPVSDKAEKDGLGQVITDTYIKGVAYNTSTENMTITYGDGDTTTVSIPDTKYSVFTSSVDGLVPKSSGSGDSAKFLRGDSTWAAVPTFAGSSAGLVPTATAGDATKYLTGAGTWNGVFATNTAGLVPGPTVSDATYSLKANGTWSADIDTKNTAGATNDTTNKLYVVGAQTQGSNPQTYSNVNVYVQNNRVFSNGVEVVNLSDSQALTNKTYEGMTLGNAAARAVATTLDDTDAGYVSSAIPDSDLITNYVPDAISNAFTNSTFVESDVIADGYDPTQTYNIGDYAAYNNTSGVGLYRCNTNNTTGAWDDTKWDLVTVASVLARVPAPPTTDGTYTLSVTISSGVATYSWV